MGALVLEEPAKVGLDIDAALLRGPDHAQQRGPALGSADASSEERGVPQLGVTLELALGDVVVEGQGGIIDEAGEAFPVVEGVVHHFGDRVGRREASQGDCI